MYFRIIPGSPYTSGHTVIIPMGGEGRAWEGAAPGLSQTNTLSISRVSAPKGQDWDLIATRGIWACPLSQLTQVSPSLLEKHLHLLVLLIAPHSWAEWHIPRAATGPAVMFFSLGPLWLWQDGTWSLNWHRMGRQESLRLADLEAVLNSCPSVLPTEPRPKLATSYQPREWHGASCPAALVLTALCSPPYRPVWLLPERWPWAHSWCLPTDVHGFLPSQSSFPKVGTELGDGSHTATNLPQLRAFPPGRFSALSSLWSKELSTLSWQGLERKWKRLLQSPWSQAPGFYGVTRCSAKTTFSSPPCGKVGPGKCTLATELFITERNSAVAPSSLSPAVNKWWLQLLRIKDGEAESQRSLVLWSQPGAAMLMLHSLPVHSHVKT